MKVNFGFGGIAITLSSERELSVSSSLSPFVQNKDKNAELEINLTWDWENAPHPASEPIGEDLLQQYYREKHLYFCEAKGGKAPVTCTAYAEDFSWMICAVNEKPFIEPPKSLERIFQLLPMRAVFAHFRTLFLHASQVSINNKGILFSAPSGTGKTTQAKLWRKYLGAEIVCNDRTLIRKKEGIWHTYGYPIDGSEPVRSSEVNNLGAIVLLKKGKINEVKRLTAGQAAGLLMEQVVIDCWNMEDRITVLNLLLDMLQEIPVYQQICTPDKTAVECLKEKFIQEGVISNGADSTKIMGKSRAEAYSVDRGL